MSEERNSWKLRWAFLFGLIVGILVSGFLF
jgi:hypothetical protein